MTEHEKRRRIIEIFEQESARLSSHRVYDYHAAPSLRRMEQRQSIMSSLAQNGITWEQLRDAYNEELKRGQQEMMAFHLTFFYAASAIVFQEQFPESNPQEVADFMTALQNAPKESPNAEALNLKCTETTGFDATVYDRPGTSGPSSRANMQVTHKASRKDTLAIVRMQESGITEADLEYERRIGYQNGWNTTFHISVCYAALALVLHNGHNFDVEAIEAFVERIGEVCDEEISAADILDRAREEAGVDVSDLVCKQPCLS